MFPNSKNSRVFFTGGSPIYWSYEQGKAFETFLENQSLAISSEIDPSTDIYSFGLIMKEIIYGGERRWRVGHKIDHLFEATNFYSKRILEKATNYLDKIADKCLRRK